jgi:hypothetical protein
MSSIPLLGGLSAMAAAATLTLMAATELQFEDRVTADQAELLATAIAQANGTAAAGNLDALFAEAASTFIPDQTKIRSAQVSSPDGTTIEVRLCRAAKPWALAWLGTAAPTAQVCALARARAV